MDRMDMIHHFFTVARKRDESNRGLHRYPLPSDPKVLDLGCGTGIWTIDVSEYVIHHPGPFCPRDACEN